MLAKLTVLLFSILVAVVTASPVPEKGEVPVSQAHNTMLEPTDNGYTDCKGSSMCGSIVDSQMVPWCDHAADYITNERQYGTKP
jgi:hypothetical protein